MAFFVFWLAGFITELGVTLTGREERDRNGCPLSFKQEQGLFWIAETFVETKWHLCEDKTKVLQLEH